MDQKDIDRYLKKSKDGFIVTDNLIKNEHGFASYEIKDDELWLYSVYGNGKYWEQFFLDMAK